MGRNLEHLPLLCAVSLDQGKEREGNEDRGHSRHKEEHIPKGQRWEALPSKIFGLFWMVLPSADDVSPIRYWLDCI